MNYKIEGIIRKNRGRFVIFFGLWLFMTIALIAPIAYAQHRATVNGAFDFGECVIDFVGSYGNFGNVLRKFYKLYE